VKDRGVLTLLLPLGAVLFIATGMAVLGTVFTLTGNIGAITIGLLLVLGVPVLGALLSRR
jgi:hypothetical protein